MRISLGMALLLVACCVGGTRARARAVPSEPPTPRRQKTPSPEARVVVLVASGSQRQVALKVARAVRNHLLDLRVTFRLRWVKRLPEGLTAQFVAARTIALRERAMVVLWCSHATVDQVFLFITRFKEERLLVRQVNRARDGALGRFEAMGAIVRSGVEAILQGARVGTRPPPPPPPRRRQPPPRRRQPPRMTPSSPSTETPRPLGVSVDVGYSLTGFAPTDPLLHAGVVGLSVALHRHWGLRLGYRFAPAVRVQDTPTGIDLRIFQHALGLGGIFQWPLGRWSVAVQATAVLALQSWSATAPAPLRAAPDGVDLTVGVDVMATVAWRARPWLSVFGGVSATVLLWNRTYDAHVDGQWPTILAPFPVQPQLVIGLRFDVF
jgi:hypothetical protein